MANVEVHDCVKDGETVVIKAQVVRPERRGDFTVLTAHSPKCKKVK